MRFISDFGKFLCAATALVLAGCGGGGSSSPAPSPVQTAPAPTVTLSFATQIGKVGNPMVLTWSSENATNCVGADNLSGNQATSGTSTITPSSGGQFKYTINCTGAGGSATHSANLIVPHPVLASSYENKAANLLASTNLPALYDPSMVAVLRGMDPSESQFSPRSISIADFLQEGNASLFVATSRYTNAFPGDNPAKWPDSPGKVHFLRKGANSQWIDETSRLIPDPTQRDACITSSYSIVADFNNDSRPDVYLSCTGIDFQLNGVWTDDQSSQQLVFLSQPGGSYKRSVVAAGVIYGHEATAGDLNGDGNIDIVTVDPVKNKKPFVLWGKGDGTFAPDITRFPAETDERNIYGALLVKIDGALKLILSGFDQRSQPAGFACFNHCFGTKVYRYSSGAFVVDQDLTPLIPIGTNGLAFGLALDHIIWNGALYTYHVNMDYSENAVVQYDLAAGTSKTIYSKVVATYGDALNLINITRDGYLENYGAACNTNNPLTANGICKLKQKL